MYIENGVTKKKILFSYRAERSEKLRNRDMKDWEKARAVFFDASGNKKRKVFIDEKLWLFNTRRTHAYSLPKKNLVLSKQRYNEEKTYRLIGAISEENGLEGFFLSSEVF